MTDLVKLPNSAIGARPSALFDDTMGEEDNLDAGIGQSYGILGYRGKVWTLRYHGNTYTIQDPHTGRPAQVLHGVILSSAASKSKSFYPPGDFDPNDNSGKRPMCSSINGDIPDADVQAKQADSCAICPNNQFYTNPKTGRQTRDCTDYKRLAFLLLPVYTAPLLGEPLMEPIFLRVPPASLRGLSTLAEITTKAGWQKSWTYITEISFAPKAWPEMVFNWAKEITDDQVPLIKEMRANPLVGRIIGGTLRSVAPSLPAPGSHSTMAAPSVPLTVAPLNVAGASPPSPHPSLPSAQTSIFGFGTMASAPRATPTIEGEAIPTVPPPTPSSGVPPTLFPSTQRDTSLTTMAAPAPVAQTSPSAPGGATPADPVPNTGTALLPSLPATLSLSSEQVEAADAELDAAIAGVLKPQG